jgi:hypothetical protein
MYTNVYICTYIYTYTYTYADGIKTDSQDAFKWVNLCVLD